jgi:hypothetical protein
MVISTEPGSAAACTRAATFRVAEHLPSRIDNHWPAIEADARGKLWRPFAGVPGVDCGESALDRERGPHSAFGVVFLRARIAEKRHQPVAEFFEHMAAESGHGA